MFWNSAPHRFVRQHSYAKALVDSTPPQRNMKSIDLPFTSDSFKHKACDVSVANLQSQYTSLYITAAGKEKEKREKEIPVISDRAASSSELCVAEVRLVVVWCFFFFSHLTDLM